MGAERKQHRRSGICKQASPVPTDVWCAAATGARRSCMASCYDEVIRHVTDVTSWMQNTADAQIASPILGASGQACTSATEATSASRYAIPCEEVLCAVCAQSERRSMQRTAPLCRLCCLPLRLLPRSRTNGVLNTMGTSPAAMWGNSMQNNCRATALRSRELCNSSRSITVDHSAASWPCPNSCCLHTCDT